MSLANKLQGELEMMRGVYERAKERLNGTDEEWKIRKARLTSEIYTQVKSFHDADPASKAVFIIGKIQGAIQELDQPRLLVMEYENKQKTYAMACAQEGVEPVI